MLKEGERDRDRLEERKRVGDKHGDQVRVVKR